MMGKKNSFDRDYDEVTFDTGDTGGIGDTGTTDAKQRLSGLSSRASTQIDNSPLMALGAGLALGAALAATLPVGRKERELLEPYGKKLNDAGTSAFDRSRTAAKQKFDEMAGDKVREFLGGGGSPSSSSSSTSSSTSV
jgi:hypothetical protein